MPVLEWLSRQPVSGVRIEGVGLRTIYDECHGEDNRPVEPAGKHDSPSSPANPEHPVEVV